MKTNLLFGCIAGLAFTFYPFHRSVAQNTSIEIAPPAKVIVLLREYPTIAGLLEFGTRTGSAIRVAVYRRVVQPGIYYLPPGTVVRDAILSAKGADRLADWNNSYLLRPIDAEHAERIKFSRRTKSTDLKITLKEGDRLYLSESGVY